MTTDTPDAPSLTDWSLEQPPLAVTFSATTDTLLIPGEWETLQTLCARWLSVVHQLVMDEQLHALLGLNPAASRWEVDVQWVDNATIQQLNRDYRQKDTPTDVLSFPGLDASAACQPLAGLPIVSLGAIVISVEEAQGHTTHPEALWPYLLERLTHGLLHLLGHHHDTETDYTKVVALQNRVLATLFASAERGMQHDG